MAIKEKETEKARKAEKRTAQEEKVEKKIEPQLEEERELEERKGEKKEGELERWVPRTELGKAVKEGKIKSMDEIFNQNLKILEAEIVDALLPGIEAELINIGQAKGKFGGGKRRPWRQTQKKTAEGNVPTFSCLVAVGNRDGWVGLGLGKAKETVPAKLKAIREAKLSIIPIVRGCGSFECLCKEPHSIPFTVEGKCSSVRIKLMPAPKGTGLVVDDECKKILKLAGIKDIYSKSFGQTRTKINLARATMAALKKLE